MNLLARHYLAIYDRDKKTVDLERAWKVTQAALATGKVERAQKDEAIRRAVELTPKIREELGRTWLEESFTQRPERGMEIIAAIGSASSQGLQNHAFDGDFRLKSLELQKLAVEALLQKAPRLGKDWAEQPGTTGRSLAARGRILLSLRLLDQPRAPHAVRPVRQRLLFQLRPIHARYDGAPARHAAGAQGRRRRQEHAGRQVAGICRSRG